MKLFPSKKVKKEKFLHNNIKGIIYSGGPSSVESKTAPTVPNFLYDLKIPILGVCYGLQLICKDFGGEVKFSKYREFGRTKIKILKSSSLFKGSYKLKKNYNVWMSHSDKVIKMPKGFETLASSESCKDAVIQNENKKFFGVQFHPEVVHTEKGVNLLKNFVIDICKCNKTWSMDIFKNEIIKKIKEKVGDNRVLCGLSGEWIQQLLLFWFIKQLVIGYSVFLLIQV